MNKRVSILLAFSLFLLASPSAHAQATNSGASSYVLYALIAIVVLLVLGLVIFVADNLLKIEAKQLGLDKEGDNFSIFPSMNEIVSSNDTAVPSSEKVTTLKKGFDILLKGEAEEHIDASFQANTYAVQPPNFIGMSPIPKVIVEVGDEVKAGEVLFYDKKVPDVKYVSPVSGEIIAINRGAKRSIAEVVILADKTQSYQSLPSFDLEHASRTDLVNYLMANGGWGHIRQRPYDVVPAATDVPKAIFISTFDTAPLAPNLSFVVQGKEAAFQKGLDVLSKLTPGHVHLGLNAKKAGNISSAFTHATGVVKNWFNGPHPAGNVGIQIHHTDPICAGENVWTLNVQDVITLGKMFTEGQYNAERIVAITGAEFGKNAYAQTYLGANVGELIKGNVEGENIRLISGDVLSGTQITDKSFLNFSDDQVTSVSEGDYYEMFGWLLPLTPRPTISNTYPNFLFPDIKFKADTNTHGEKRAFVVTGQYESVLPMDIYPQHLMKAILVEDLERMEGLGLYELTEEDVALCEFVCTSKQPLQKILRQGLNTMLEQG